MALDSKYRFNHSMLLPLEPPGTHNFVEFNTNSAVFRFGKLEQPQCVIWIERGHSSMSKRVSYIDQPFINSVQAAPFHLRVELPN